MKCKSCQELIDFKMKKAFSSNECPYCGGPILEAEAAKQLADLHSIIDPQKFTTSEWHDKKLKEAIISLLMEYTKCTKIKDVNEGVIDLNQAPPTSEPQLQPQSQPQSQVSGETKKSQPIKPHGDKRVIDEQNEMRENIYQQVAREQYGDGVGENNHTIEEDEVSSAEAAALFPVEDPKIIEKVERLKGKISRI